MSRHPSDAHLPPLPSPAEALASLGPDPIHPPIIVDITPKFALAQYPDVSPLAVEPVVVPPPVEETSSSPPPPPLALIESPPPQPDKDEEEEYEEEEEEEIMRKPKAKRTRVNKCGVCGKLGHNKQTCPSNLSKKKASPGKKKRTRVNKCGVCNELGHNKQTCPQNDNKNPSKQRTPAKRARSKRKKVVVQSSSEFSE